MLAQFFLKRKIRTLVSRSGDANRMDRYDSILELGRLPPTDESLACLIRHTRIEDSAVSRTAVSALGMMNDHRATSYLLSLLRRDDRWADTVMEDALGQPHHASGLPELAELVRARKVDELSRLVGVSIEIMKRIGLAASQPYFETLAPLVLKGVLKEQMNLEWAEEILTLCRQPPALEALRTVQDKLALHHGHMIMTADTMYEISRSLQWLRKSTRPHAAEAVAAFLRTPSRRVKTFVTRELSEYDSPNLAYETVEETGFTSELGQPAGPEELQFGR